MIYLLKKLSSDLPLKHKVLELLSGGEGASDSNLVSVFGDREYSILSALAS